MSLIIDPQKLLEYFDNVVDQSKADQLHSARCFSYIITLIRNHGKDYKCYCFLCKISRLLIQTLPSRKHYKLLVFVNTQNYLTATNDYLYNFI